MTDPSKEQRRGERAAQVGLAVRIAMMIWDVVWTLVLHGTDPGRPL